jgi:hypothetical protein
MSLANDNFSPVNVQNVHTLHFTDALDRQIVSTAITFDILLSLTNAMGCLFLAVRASDNMFNGG